MGAELGLAVVGVGAWREEQFVHSEHATMFETGSENWFLNSLGCVSTPGSGLSDAHFLFYDTRALFQQVVARMPHERARHCPERSARSWE
jgi:hypothetical protein